MVRVFARLFGMALPLCLAAALFTWALAPASRAADRPMPAPAAGEARLDSEAGGFSLIHPRGWEQTGQDAAKTGGTYELQLTPPGAPRGLAYVVLKVLRVTAQHNTAERYVFDHGRAARAFYPAAPRPRQS